MDTDIPCEAIRRSVCLEINYGGYSRTVEVHAVGFSKEGHTLLRVWQVSGGSASGERAGWKPDHEVLQTRDRAISLWLCMGAAKTPLSVL
jgi:hypothetical protein